MVDASAVRKDRAQQGRTAACDGRSKVARVCGVPSRKGRQGATPQARAYVEVGVNQWTYRTAPPKPRSITLADAMPWWAGIWWIRRAWWFLIGYGRRLQARDDKAWAAVNMQMLRKHSGVCWGCGDDEPALRRGLCDTCECLWREGHLILGNRPKPILPPPDSVTK